MPKIKFHNIPLSLQRRVRTHVAAKAHSFFAIVQPGFERIALGELKKAGIGNDHTIEHGGIAFSGKLPHCYAANIACRTITRVLLRISEFRVRRFAKLRELAGEIPWELFITPNHPISFSSAVHNSRLYHRDRIAQEFYRAIRARFTAFALNIPPRKEAEMCDSDIQTIFIRIVDDLCTVSLDSTGEPLYKRGYKIHTSDAPLRETAAAAILLEAGLEHTKLFIDPMAGSGTFSLEGGMIARNIPPSQNRRFTFELWPCYHPLTRTHFEKAIQSRIIPSGNTEFRLIVSDINPKALDAAHTNLKSAGLDDIASFHCKDFFSSDFIIPDETSVFIVLNPPYGKRLFNSMRARDIYKKIGEKLRTLHFVRYAIIVPGEEFERALSLPYIKSISFHNGGIAVKAILR